jgi:hypothetical protein
MKRRNVFKVGVAYAVTAWLLIQIASTLLPAFGAPDWVMPVFASAILLGFPAALILAWAFELTPGGIKTTRSIDPANSVTPTTGRRLNYLTIGLLGAAVVYMFVDNYILDGARGNEAATRSDAAAGVAVQQSVPARASADDSPSSARRTVALNSVAVLPFENLSPNEDDRYFAAGMYEEVLNRLAKLKKLNVISRTTMTRYTDSDLSVPEIARELNRDGRKEGVVSRPIRSGPWTSGGAVQAWTCLRKRSRLRAGLFQSGILV